MKRDLYETLGVAKNADEKELKSAFRKLAMQYHPDKNPGDAASEKTFKEINQAYETLKDPQKRAAYDRYGHAAFEQGGMGNGFGGGAGGAGGFSDIFEDIFGEMMGGGRQRRSSGGRERGADLRYNMEISLEEAYSGKTAQIRVPTSITCDVCTGSGAKPGTSPKTCGTCQGSGRVRAAQGFFRSSAPARPAAAAARRSPTPAPSATARAASPRSARSPSTFRPASKTALASAFPAKGKRACAADRRAISISSSRSSRMSSTSATAPIFIAACRSR